MGRIKQVAILGSTGSIGRQTLEVISTHPDHFSVIALAAGKNQSLLTRQISRFKPKFVHLQEKGISLGKVKLLSMEEIASHPEVDIVVVATSGSWGLRPTLAAIEAGKQVALANKESLVMAGEIITARAKKAGLRIRPIDSEHSAIWQCLEGEKTKPSKIILTASGGPFYNYSRARLSQVTPAQALKHPSWRMGEKVTIDSATLMNKGLEVIEAHWLFEMPIDKINVLIHPQSIIHSMVEFSDGSVKAQLGYPDMRLPISYALSYPERLDNPKLPRLDWAKIRELTFQAPDPKTFPCLGLAIDAGRRGGTYPAVLCGADEAAVSLFLSGKIRFTDIPRLIARALNDHKPASQPTLEEILEAESWAKEKVRQLARGERQC